MDIARGLMLEWVEELLQMIVVNINFILYNMIGSYIIGYLTLLNVLIQYLPLQSMFWSKLCGACQTSRKLHHVL